MNTDLMFSSKTDNWSTPIDFFQTLVDEFGPFDLDPAADHENHKAPRYFTREDDWLSQPWDGKVFCNPPYWRELKKWVEKCSRERERELYWYVYSSRRELIRAIFTTIFTIVRAWRSVLYEVDSNSETQKTPLRFPLCS